MQRLSLLILLALTAGCSANGGDAAVDGETFRIDQSQTAIGRDHIEDNGSAVPTTELSLPLTADEEGIVGIPYGSSIGAASTALAPLLGGPSRDWTPDADFPCPSGAERLISWGDFTLEFGPAGLMGWTTRATDPQVVEYAAGLQVGSTVADLQAAMPDVAIEETTLGWEFWQGTNPRISPHGDSEAG